MEIDGRTHQSQPFRVRILEASEQPSEAEGVFLRATVSTTTPYVGQQVIYVWRFYRRVQVGDAQLVPMEFDGFVVEDLGEVREYRSTWQGQEYLVSEIRKALFPQEEGTLTIPPSQLQCQVVVEDRRQRRRSLFDDFFGRQRAERRVLRTQAIELNVRPLPPAPAGFTGLVGDFDVRSEISKRVGDREDHRLGHRQRVDDQRARDRVARAVQDLRRQAVELDQPFRLTYFDPGSGSYRTASAGAISLRVRPAEGKEELRLTEAVAPSTGKVAVKILADDILPIYKGLDAVAAVPFAHRLEPLWLGGVLAPPLVYLGLLIAQRRRRHFERNSVRNRMSPRESPRRRRPLVGPCGSRRGPRSRRSPAAHPGRRAAGSRTGRAEEGGLRAGRSLRHRQHRLRGR